jgi:hypothetical protein
MHTAEDLTGSSFTITANGREAELADVLPARDDIRAERKGLLRDGIPVESYRRLDLDEALGMLASRGPRSGG